MLFMFITVIRCDFKFRALLCIWIGVKRLGQPLQRVVVVRDTKTKKKRMAVNSKGGNNNNNAEAGRNKQQQQQKGENNNNNLRRNQNDRGNNNKRNENENRVDDSKENAALQKAKKEVEALINKSVCFIVSIYRLNFLLYIFTKVNRNSTLKKSQPKQL
jgi:hypothetical protein